MSQVLLSQVHLNWTGRIWLDTGIFFPFFNKQHKTDVMAWTSELLSISRKCTICTTKLVKNEVHAVWTHWHPEARRKIANRYQVIFQKVNIVNVSCEAQGKLSAADVSLKERKVNELLITSDRLLFESDTGPAVLLKLAINDYQQPMLQMVQKKRR